MQQPSFLPSFLDAFSDQAEIPACEILDAQLRQRYPGVPYPYYQTWEQSDEHTKHTTQWRNSLKHMTATFSAAAEACRNLADAPTAQLPSMVETFHLLRSVIYTTEDFLAELSLMYPGDLNDNPLDAQRDSRLQHHIPQLLCCSPSEVILWLPTLPPKSRGSSSHLYTELKELLHTQALPHFHQWHCDFIHTFHPDPDHPIAGLHDVDNYAYKPVIDALALAFTACDSEEHFSCSMYNLVTESIPEGCYIRVTKRAEKVGFFTDFEERIISIKTPQKP